MQTVTRSPFTTVRTEGGLLPPDLLQRISDGRTSDGRPLEGLRPEEYHLFAGERLNEAINRAWSRLLGAWRGFDQARQVLAESDHGTTLTRDRWLLVLFEELGYGRLQAQRGSLTAGEESYAISHLWAGVLPLHLVTFRQDLDKRSPAGAAAKKTPHGLMQEYLNRAPEHQWGVIANGLRLRLLRDNAALRRAAYVEFDLEAMMAGELYAEFTLLWLVLHQSRFEPRSAPAPSAAAEPAGAKSDRTVRGANAAVADEVEEENDDARPGPLPCWIETWQQTATMQGTRALDALRDGVQTAIEALGAGFLAHPANATLRTQLASGDLTTHGYYQQVRRLTYRLLFLFVAEERDLLLLPETTAATRSRYERYYSLRHLRERAATLRGGPHPDLYRQVRLLCSLLRDGYAPLGLPGLGSFLFSGESTPDLEGGEMANVALLAAIRALSFTESDGVRRPVDYRNLDSEELGSVYESLLELHPRLHLDAGRFELVKVSGSERKTTGSHYTPSTLVEALLDSALEPVVTQRLRAADERWRKGDRSREQALLREEALLRIKVVDYATGSGHMLIGAGRRLAAHLARIRSGDEEPAPPAYRHALRDVVRHCLYAVDLNDTAVELCKVALWMESMEPGKPLSFLDAHIQVGNSLIGVAPGLDIDTIPDDAFTARTGDDKQTAAGLKRRNKSERAGQGSLILAPAAPAPNEESLAAKRLRQKAALEEQTEESAEAVRSKAGAYQAWRQSREYKQAKQEAHLWTSAFFWPLPAGDQTYAGAPTQQVLDEWRRRPDATAKERKELLRQVNALAKANRFFHWGVEFPEIFQRPEQGFDVVLSNPPWEHTELKEKEFFAVRAPQIADAPNGAARKRLIENLQTEDPALFDEFNIARRAHDNVSHFVRFSEHYPLCGRGRINTYAIFAELARQVVSPSGRVGVIVPTGIATDDTTKYYFQAVMDTGTLASLYDFENRKGIFPGVHRSYKFCLLTLGGGSPATPAPAEFVFFASEVVDLLDGERRFALSAAEIALLNPNTRTCPIFRSRRDAELTKAIYRRVPVLIKEGPPEENPWGITFKQGLFNMTSDSHLFRTRPQLEQAGWRLEGNRFVRGDEVYLPLYEGRLGHQYNHRFASENSAGLIDVGLSQLQDPHYSVSTNYFVSNTSTQERVSRRTFNCITGLLGHRRVARDTDERTAIAAILPWGAASYGWILSTGPSAEDLCVLLGAYNSFAFDYLLRNSLSQPSIPQGTFQQIPVPDRSAFSEAKSQFIVKSVLELTYTAWDLAPFARDCGYDGPPFRWDVERRFLLRAELDAAYFHLYGIAREDVAYILDTFPIVKRKELARYGEYRSQRVILEFYDGMGEPHP